MAHNMANKLSHKLSHTMIRGRTYYTNFRLNDSTSLVRISLGTDSYKQAEILMNQVRPFIPLVQNGTMQVDEFKSRLKGFRTATKKDFDEYLLNWLQSGVDEAKRLPELGRYQKLMTDSPISPHVSAEEARGYSNHYLGNMYNGNDMSARMMIAALKIKKLEVKEDDIEQVYQAANQIDMNQAMMSQAYEAFYSGDLSKYQQIIDSMTSSLQKAASVTTQLPEEIREQTPKSLAPSLLECWNDYTNDKGKNWRKSIASENQRFFDVLCHVVGDIPVDQITKQLIRESLKVAENLPTRTKLPYSRMSLAECIEYDVPEDDLITSEHVHKHLKLWRSLLKTYLVDRRDILTKSPTEGIKYEVKVNRGGSYTSNELKILKIKLFEVANDNWRKWYFLTLIYTGARRSEIAELKKKNIRFDADSNRWYIFIDAGKTENSRRMVPIHKDIESGILGEIAALNDSEYIFNNLPNYTSITNEWTTLMNELNIPDLNEFGLKRRVHSLRHTFISNAISKVGNSALVQLVVGHSLSQSLGITARYTHAPLISDLLQVIDKTN